MRSRDVGAYWERNAAAWIELSRAGRDIYRDALNTPAFLAALPSVEGLKGVDLGCGDGANTRRLAQLGARMTGVDIAPTFVDAARADERREPLGIAFAVGDASALTFPDEAFDFAVAFMSFMDMADPAAALREAARVLADGGFLQFSILHPCFAPPHRKTLRDANGRAYAIEIADYFRRTDGEIDTWLFAEASPEERARLAPFEVPRFHRTLEDWVSMILSAGFRIEALMEPAADEETARAQPRLATTRIAPTFLHLRLRKPSAPLD